MSGKNARRRAGRANGGEAVQPSRAVASTPRESTRHQPVAQQVANSQTTTGAPSNPPDRVTRAQLADKLWEISTFTLRGLENAQDVWVASRFAGDGAALAAAAMRGDEKAQIAVSFILSGVRRQNNEDSDVRAAAVKGDVKAQLAMALESLTCTDERSKWLRKAQNNGNIDVCIYTGCLFVRCYLTIDDGKPERAAMKDKVILLLRVPADRGSATAQHVLGMLLYFSHCDAGTKADFLDAARWIRMAATQGIMEAQYELGEMFRLGLFCDTVYMRLARNYVRRASVQGHVDALVRMQQLRSCVLCGAVKAPLACALCHQARYCDSVCSKKHWCEGGGVGGDVMGGAGARHKHTCPRTHPRRSNDEGAT